MNPKNQSRIFILSFITGALVLGIAAGQCEGQNATNVQKSNRKKKPTILEKDEPAKRRKGTRTGQKPHGGVVTHKIRVVTADKNGKVNQYQAAMLRGQKTDLSRKRVGYFIEKIGDGVELTMAHIPAGAFTMGSPKNEADRDKNDDEDQHQITLKMFYIGQFEVTQAQWRAVARKTELRTLMDLPENPSRFKGDKLPVEQITQPQAVEFCERLSKLTGRKYRLPSEAEWEYACRAGTQTRFAFGETLTPSLANYDQRTTTLVGNFDIANAFGLYDMQGNVGEYCQDWYHKKYDLAVKDGQPREDKSDQGWVVRGGAWARPMTNCRCADRGWREPDKPDDGERGFRIVTESDRKSPKK